VSRAPRITDKLIATAADAAAQLSDATRPGAALLPPVPTCARSRAAVARQRSVAASQGGAGQSAPG
jgi:malic enzyme